MVVERERNKERKLTKFWREKTMASKKCDFCKLSPATLFCRADSAFLCVSCDSEVHAANKLASRHARVWVCEVCEQAPAHVTCKADAAALCVTCDRDIHSANPLAQRHERVAVTPFYDSVNSVRSHGFNFLDDCYYPEIDRDANISSEEAEEAEAASWLLPNPNPKAMENPDLNSGFVFPEMDPYQDLDDYGEADLKIEAQEQICSGADGVVPEQSESIQALVMNHHRHCFEMDFPGKKLFQSRSQSLSSSSLEVGVVPENNAMNEISNPYSTAMNTGLESTIQPPQFSAIDREARVMRYREKRKNRKFEKTIRYASRKAYAETRPRIKGRFAKRTVDAGAEGDRLYGFGVVPSF